VKRFFIFVAIFAVWAPAEYFSDYQRPVMPEAPKNVMSLDWMGRYATGGLDHALVFALDRPVTPRLRLGADLGVHFLLDGIFGSVVSRYRTRGRIRIEEFEEWVSLSGGWISRDAIGDPVCGQECSEWRSAPMLQLGYGRDMLGWSNAHFGLRLELKFGVVFGSVLTRPSTGALGRPETKSGNIMIELRGGAFWF